TRRSSWWCHSGGLTERIVPQRRQEPRGKAGRVQDAPREDDERDSHGLSRRRLLKLSAGAALGAAEAALPARAAEPVKPADPAGPRGKADACIFLWLGGGASHIDTFDPKV